MAADTAQWKPPEQLTQLNAGVGLIGTVLEQLAGQVKLVSDKTTELTELITKKVDGAQIEELKLRIDAMEKALANKAELVEVEQVNTNLQTLNNTVARKAEHTKLEQLESQIQSFGPILTQKADIVKADDLGAKLNALSDIVTRLVEYPVADQLKHDMQLLSDTVKRKAEVTALDQLHTQVHSLSTNVATKADTAVVDKLASQQQAFGHVLQQKAEAVDLTEAQRGLHRLEEQLYTLKNVTTAGAEIAQLSRTIERKAESAHMEQLSAKLFGEEGEMLTQSLPVLGGQLGANVSSLSPARPDRGHWTTISSAPVRAQSASRPNRLKQWNPAL